MSDVDTSREAVERLAELWEWPSWAGGEFNHARAAATLRALLAERDAAILAKAEAVVAVNKCNRERMQAESDAYNTRAEVARLREVVADAVECVEAWGAYASDYFKDKHDLAGDIARLNAALAEPTP